MSARSIARLAVAAMLAMVAMVTGALADSDPARGGQLYRACVACHSLEPGSHLTGPSLAGLWQHPAGRAKGFDRYSEGLRAADFDWDAAVLDAWLADPRTMLPDTRMVFRGIPAERDRADLVAFLALAMAPGGAEAVVDRGLVPAGYARGQKPEPLTPTPPGARVTKVRHCGDSYFVTTADGAETAHWEMNVRLKLDTRDTGPAPGAPVIVGAGMMGDRVSIVFASLRDLNNLVEESC